MCPSFWRSTVSAELPSNTTLQMNQLLSYQPSSPTSFPTHLCTVTGNAGAWMVLALVSSDSSHSWGSCPTLPPLPFHVSACPALLGCGLHRHWWLGQGCRIFTSIDTSTVYVKAVYFACSHHFCLLEVQMQSFGTSFFHRGRSDHGYFLPVKRCHLQLYWSL